MSEQVKKRVAIYTRKSVEDGLEQEFNSLDAQREAGEAYIASQRANGWVLVADRYDDGGYSGGNTNRPALMKLLEDCKNNLVDIVVVYKIDRLSRSICDFAELMKQFEQWNVQFVAVTQEINTATSAGRMMLNILMSFSQYERELISERTRDKMGASRKKGLWVGGVVILGYKVENKKLVVVPEEAKIVRQIFQRYIEVQSSRIISEELNQKGITNKNGKPWSPAAVNRTLTNHTYVGEVNYQGKSVYTGVHEPIVSQDVWMRVQRIIEINNPITDNLKRNKILAPLKGILRCGHCGCPMMPTYGKKKEKKYFYYICEKATKVHGHVCPVKTLSAGTIEKMVRDEFVKMFFTSDITMLVAQATNTTVTQIEEYFKKEFWDALSPGEYARLFRLMLELVVVYENKIEIELKTQGVKKMIKEIIKNG